MATSQPPDPQHLPVTDRPPTEPDRPDGAPTTPARLPRRRRTASDRRTTIDARTQAAIDAAIGRIVADAPPLSDDTRERLAALLSTTTYRPNTTRRPAA